MTEEETRCENCVHTEDLSEKVGRKFFGCKLGWTSVVDGVCEQYEEKEE